MNQGQVISEMLFDTARYTEKEIDALHELYNLRKTTGFIYFKKWGGLEMKKNKLFKQGYSKNWEVNLKSFNLKQKDLEESKVLAKYLMLPKVNINIFSLKILTNFLERKLNLLITSACFLDILTTSFLRSRVY
jgi:hypothetical protein